MFARRRALVLLCVFACLALAVPSVAHAAIGARPVIGSSPAANAGWVPSSMPVLNWDAAIDWGFARGEVYDTPGQARGIDIVGTTAYVADANAGLRILDVSDPNAVTVLGTLDTSGSAQSVQVVGTTAYVADGASGLAIINVSNPAAPTLLGKFTNAPDAIDVDMNGTKALVTMLGSGFRIVDVSNPAATSMLGSYTVTGGGFWAYSAAWSGDTVCLACATGVRLIDATNPGEMITQATYILAGAKAIDVADGYAYVGTGNTNLTCISVSNPASPALCDAVSTPYPVSGVRVAGGTAYAVGGYNSGVCGVDVRDAANLTVIGSAVTPGTGYDTAVCGDTVYVASFEDGVVTVNMAVKSPPERIGACVPGSGNYDVAVWDDLAFLASYSEGLSVVDVSDPTAPGVAGSLLTSASAYAVEAVGSRAYLVGPSLGLTIVDASTPSAPHLLGSFSDGGWDVAVAGTTAYVACDTAGLEVVDVSNSAAPSLMGFCSLDGTYGDGRAIGVAISGTTVYLACEEAGLQIFDVSDPELPHFLGKCDTPGFASSVAVAGSYAYVADADGGLQIINVVNPAAPVVAATYLPPDTGEPTPCWFTSVSVRNGFVSATDIISGLQVIDVANPLAPVLIGSAASQGPGYGVATLGTNAFVANETGELEVFDIHMPVEYAYRVALDGVPSPHAPMGSQPATLPIGVADGTRYFYMVRAGVGASWSSETVQEIFFDSTRPSATISIAGGAQATASSEVTVGLSATDAASGVSRMNVSADSAFNAESREAFATSKSVTLFGDDGTKTVMAKIYDVAGNSTIASDTIFLDSTTPSATVVIAGGASMTTTRSVTIAITGSDPSSRVTSMSVSTDGTFDSEPWESFSTSKSVTLPVTDGTKTVWLKVRDIAGNATTVSDTILLDATAPTVGVSIADGAAATATRSVTVAISASDSGSGVTSMSVSTDGVFDAEPVEAFAASKSVTLPIVDGAKTVWVKVADAVGNSRTATDTIVLDTTAPTAGVVIASGASVTTTRVVALAISGADSGSSVTSMAVCTDGVLDAEPWQTYSTSGSAALASGDGTKTVLVALRDGVGNSSVASDSIVLNTEAPVAVGDAADTTEGQDVVVAAPGVLANDTDSLGASLSATLAAAPASGTVALNVDGSYTYTPDAGFVGMDTFTYRAGDGQLFSEQATVTVTVFPTPDPSSIVVGVLSKTLSAYGSSYVVTGTLLTDGAPLAEKRVVLQSASSATGPFGPLSTGATTTASGAFVMPAVKPATKTWYRVVFAGETGAFAACESSVVAVTPRAKLWNPVAPSKMKRNKSTSVYAVIAPRHVAGKYALRIYKYRWTGKTWKYYGYSSAKAANTAAGSKCTASVKLTVRGRWRLRAEHPADAGHALSRSSGYDYVTVP
ncbi:MAG: cadherin-like domain-containing protein [Coriobacteriia bacterium]|nr:cadherin-like domain-containing protein [Coriobacteriia bacterium]